MISFFIKHNILETRAKKRRVYCFLKIISKKLKKSQKLPTEPVKEQPKEQPKTLPSNSNTNNNLVLGESYNQTINDICNMGFAREEVVKAMEAAFNNPDRAIEYLVNV